MIIGIGIDVIQNERIAEALDRFGDRFAKRIFTKDEIAYCTSCTNPEIHFPCRPNHLNEILLVLKEYIPHFVFFCTLTFHHMIMLNHKLHLSFYF